MPYIPMMPTMSMAMPYTIGFMPLYNQAPFYGPPVMAHQMHPGVPILHVSKKPSLSVQTHSYRPHTPVLKEIKEDPEQFTKFAIIAEYKHSKPSTPSTPKPQVKPEDAAFFMELCKKSKAEPAPIQIGKEVLQFDFKTQPGGRIIDPEEDTNKIMDGYLTEIRDITISTRMTPSDYAQYLKYYRCALKREGRLDAKMEKHLETYY